MFPRITHVRYIQDYWLELTFADGKQARLRVRVDPDIGTLVWPNEVDFCPDVLYSEATGIPLPTLEPA